MSKFDQSTILAAQQSQRVWAVPASVTLAQFALESAYGTRMPAGSNNPFGIKAVGDQPFVTASTHEVIGGRSVAVIAKFRKFSDFGEAFDAHARLLATVSLYAPAMWKWKSGDLEGGVRLMAAHYATDPTYGSTIMSIIRGQGLDQYDHLAPAPAPPPAPIPAPAPSTPPAPTNWLAALLNLLNFLLKGLRK